MKTFNQFKLVLLPAALACALSTPAQAELITNGGFEAGFSGWTRADQIGSDGTFFAQSGTSSPVNGDPVPAPPEGAFAAMTDSGAGGAHVLYQDFVVPGRVGGASIGFSLFINNSATTFSTPTPPTLAFDTPALNQQARVDILIAGTDPFSLAGADILQNLYQTKPGDPLVSGYNPLLIDITALLQAHSGETLRLRFAETDNVNIFNFGVDNVSLSSVPEPSTLMMMLGGLPALVWVRRRAGKPAS